MRSDKRELSEGNKCRTFSTQKESSFAKEWRFSIRGGCECPIDGTLGGGSQGRFSAGKECLGLVLDPHVGSGPAIVAAAVLLQWSDPRLGLPRGRIIPL